MLTPREKKSVETCEMLKNVVNYTNNIIGHSLYCTCQRRYTLWWLGHKSNFDQMQNVSVVTSQPINSNLMEK